MKKWMCICMAAVLAMTAMTGCAGKSTDKAAAETTAEAVTEAAGETAGGHHGGSRGSLRRQPGRQLQKKQEIQKKRSPGKPAAQKKLEPMRQRRKQPWQRRLANTT